MIAVPDAEEYFAEAESWDADRIAQFRRTARTAWWVAGAGWLCASASAIALLLLMPLKEVTPFLVRVDRSTGIVDVVPVFAGRATPEEAVTRYFLSHYISMRAIQFRPPADMKNAAPFTSAQRNQDRCSCDCNQS